jgi:hypothetical protein
VKRHKLATDLGLLLMLAGAGALKAQKVATDFPIIGITRGQTLQLNLTAYPNGPCSALFTFRDSNGNLIVPLQQASLSAGQSVSVALNGNTIANAAGQRVEVLPQVAVANLSFPPTCSAAATAEVFDNFLGSTSVLVPGVAGYPFAPVFGTVGVTVFETVRLNVAAQPFANPCIATLTFADKNGNPLGGSMVVNLNPGQSTFLDLPGTAVVSTLGQRAEVHPIVTLGATTGGNACIASTEVYLGATGTTVTYLVPEPI